MKIAIEIVDLPIQNGDFHVIFNSYVSLPEGNDGWSNKPSVYNDKRIKKGYYTVPILSVIYHYFGSTPQFINQGLINPGLALINPVTLGLGIETSIYNLYNYIIYIYTWNIICV